MSDTAIYWTWRLERSVEEAYCMNLDQRSRGSIPEHRMQHGLKLPYTSLETT